MTPTNGSGAAPVRLREVRSTYRGGGGPDKTILLSAERHDPKRVRTVVAYVRDVRDDQFSIGARARGRGFLYHELVEPHARSSPTPARSERAGHSASTTRTTTQSNRTMNDSESNARPAVAGRA